MLYKVQAAIVTTITVICCIVAGVVILVPVVVLVVACPEASLGVVEMFGSVAEGCCFFFGSGQNDKDPERNGGG